uniref:Putative oxidase n=1 Tax=Taxus baccata TaxID=25629 RepID=A0A0F7J3M2_TAXBA|nr:putative oxidase [Taxus baccata]
MMSKIENFVWWLLLFVISVSDVSGQAVKPGSWQLVVANGGVSAMHMTTTHKDTVVMFDRTDYGPSELLLDRGRRRDDENDMALKHDCWAHSIEYNIASNNLRPLMVMTDTWCSLAAFANNGNLVSTGGYNDGSRRFVIWCPVPILHATGDESQRSELAQGRWYASNQILPDNRIIVVGGRRSFSYEFVPKTAGEGYYKLPFLTQTNVANVENNLYPFVHLSSDGNLFVFANKDSILLDYKRNRVVKTFPTMPGGARNYPSSGSSAMLPLMASDGFQKVEILICGGAPDNAFTSANDGDFVSALQSCGRIVITDSKPGWVMEDMPAPRVMGDMLILPNGEILIINGAEKGTAGWEMGRNPALAPFLYRPSADPGRRFSTLAPSTIPRMYHSSANVLPDGRIFVGGSNPHVGYVLSGTTYPTELRLEAYSPYYLDSSYQSYRPTIVALSSSSVGYGTTFTIQFTVSNYAPNGIVFHIYAPSFTTHSFSMNQRLLVLAGNNPKKLGGIFNAVVTAPPNSVTAPGGYYMLFVVNNGIPSAAKWIHLS